MTGAGTKATKNDRVRVNSSDAIAGHLVDKIISSDGSVDISVSGCNCELDLKVISGGSSGIVSEWIKASASYTDFNVASTGINIVPAEFSGLGAGLYVSDYKIKHSVAFLGSAASSITMRLFWGAGIAGSDSFDVLSAPSDTSNTMKPVVLNQETNHSTTNDVTLRMFLSGDTGDNLTSGEIELWINVSYII